jgi:YD repeat-containing protein
MTYKLSLFSQLFNKLNQHIRVLAPIMKNSRFFKISLGRIFFTLSILLFCCNVLAQSRPGTTPTSATRGDDYYSILKLQGNIKPYGNDLFGDKINFQSGGLTFSQNDIVLNGNGPIITVTRDYNVQESVNMGAHNANLAADWNLRIPRIYTILPRYPQPAAPSYTDVMPPRGLWNAVGNNEYARCTNFASLRDLTGPAGTSAGIYFWKGARLEIPGYDVQDLLNRAPENSVIPNMSINGVQAPFNVVTNKNWMVTCLPNLKNSEPGEGFLVVSPDGTKYWFDWMIFTGIPQPYNSVRSVVASLLVTRIEDKIGNYVSYTYTGDRLDKIEASDGRRLDFQWIENLPGVSTVDPFRYLDKIISQPTSNSPRVWDYEYERNGGAIGGDTWRYGGRLRKLILPDGSSWKFAIDDFLRACYYQVTPTSWQNRCNGFTEATSYASGTMTAPSGAIGEFKITLRPVIRRVADYSVWSYLYYNFDPYYFSGASLKTKKITGINGSSTWQYSYGNYTNSGLANSYTAVTNPDGSITKFNINNTWRDPLEGKILGVDVFKNANDAQPVQSETISYSSANSGAYPQRVGLVVQLNAEKESIESYHPLKSKTLSLDGVTLNSSITSFDWFANPISITKSSSLGYTRTDLVAYENNLNKWVVGQVKTLTNTNTSPNLVVSQTIYDASTALPVQTFSNGQRVVNLTYNADGTLATVKDANNNTLGLSNYKLGTAQSLVLPDGKLLGGALNDHGWLTSTTDQLGNAMSYGYDSMGRLSNVTYPLADSTLWNPQSLNFAVATTAAYGLPVGHWYQTASTGNGRTITYYDAMWRPVLTLTEDTANTATRSFVVNRYDTSGRLAFTSYPVASLTSINDVLTGTYTEYDALGRVTKVKQDSEQGLLISTTEYLTAFKTKVTNPRGYSTTTSYQVFDTPDTSRPVLIQSPENVTTTITRDVFGKPLSVTRTGPEG